MPNINDNQTINTDTNQNLNNSFSGNEDTNLNSSTAQLESFRRAINDYAASGSDASIKNFILNNSNFINLFKTNDDFKRRVFSMIVSDFIKSEPRYYYGDGDGDGDWRVDFIELFCNELNVSDQEIIQNFLSPEALSNDYKYFFIKVPKIRQILNTSQYDNLKKMFFDDVFNGLFENYSFTIEDIALGDPENPETRILYINKELPNLPKKIIEDNIEKFKEKFFQTISSMNDSQKNTYVANLPNILSILNVSDEAINIEGLDYNLEKNRKKYLDLNNFNGILRFFRPPFALNPDNINYLSTYIRDIEALFKTSFDNFIKNHTNLFLNYLRNKGQADTAKNSKRLDCIYNFDKNMNLIYKEVLKSSDLSTPNQLIDLMKKNLKEDLLKEVQEIITVLPKLPSNIVYDLMKYVDINYMLSGNIITMEELNSYLGASSKLISKKDLLIDIINTDFFIPNIESNFKIIENEISKDKKLVYSITTPLAEKISASKLSIEPKQKEIYKSIISLIKESGDPIANNHINTLYDYFSENNLLVEFKDLKEIFEKKSDFSSYKKRYNDVYKSNPNNLTSVEMATKEEIINNRKVTKTYLPEESKQKILNTYSTYYNTSVNKNIFSPPININEKEKNKLIIHLFEKKDFFYLNNLEYFDIFFTAGEGVNQLVMQFFYKKNIDSVKFYESFAKNNYEGLQRLIKLSQEIGRYTYNVEDIYDKAIDKSQDLDKYLKYLEKGVILAKLQHNENIDTYLIEKALLNDYFNATILPNIEFLSAINSLLTTNDLYIHEGNANTIFDQFTSNELVNKINDANAKYKEKSGKNYIDTNNFINNIKSIKNIFNNFINDKAIQISDENKNNVRLVFTDINKIQKLEAIIKYVDVALPKDKKIYDLNVKLTDNIEFKVLEFLDPYTFQVGIDTDCCQRFRGAGESAAVDSFVNPLAGVLTLYFNNDLISQSYFHYVPQDNGVILDNVESSPKNIDKYRITGIILSKIYADYAQQIKNKLNLNYVKCGKNFNQIDNNLFKQLGKFNKENPDPRHFEVVQQQLTGSEGEILHKYTDCETGLIDLLQPNKKLDDVSYSTLKQSSYSPRLLKFAIRATKLNMALNQNDISKSFVRMLWLEKQFN